MYTQYYEALDARDEVLNAGEILTADLYNFVACFSEEELKFVGI